MTTPVTVVISLLRGDAAVAAIVAQRVYPGAAPQAGTLPDMIVIRTGEDEAYTLDGSTGAPETRIIVACRAKTYAEADALARAAVAALKDGVFQGATVVRDLVSDISPVDTDGGRLWLAQEGFKVIAE